MSYDEGRAQREAKEQAHRWTLVQSCRLEIMPREITAAIMRGFTTENIEETDSKYQLEDPPPYRI